MPTLFHPEQAAQEPEPLSPGKPLAEENPLDQTALSALREFFLILDAWDRAEGKKLSADVPEKCVSLKPISHVIPFERHDEIQVSKSEWKGHCPK